MKNQVILVGTSLKDQDSTSLILGKQKEARDETNDVRGDDQREGRKQGVGFSFLVDTVFTSFESPLPSSLSHVSPSLYLHCPVSRGFFPWRQTYLLLTCFKFSFDGMQNFRRTAVTSFKHWVFTVFNFYLLSNRQTDTSV